jgi:hypothetical protein
MKAIKSLLLCVISAVSFTAITPQAQAQSRSEFCQINSGNVNRFVSEYNIFNKSSNTPLRPFIQNDRPYHIGKELAAKPLFYTAISNGNVVSVFELKGRLGKLYIGKKDVVTQHIVQIGSYAEILGHCINGVFIKPQKQEVYDIYKLPWATQLALQEARNGILTEQIGNMFR